MSYNENGQHWRSGCYQPSRETGAEPTIGRQVLVERPQREARLLSDANRLSPSAATAASQMLQQRRSQPLAQTAGQLHAHGIDAQHLIVPNAIQKRLSQGRKKANLEARTRALVERQNRQAQREEMQHHHQRQVAGGHAPRATGTSDTQRLQNAANTARMQPVTDEAEGLGDGVEDNCFANFATDDLEAAGLRPHPDKIAETTALASVSAPKVSYKMSLPLAMLSSGRISAAQFMAVRQACAKHETRLKDGSRAGFFLGDGPGVGKGRQISAAILENFAKGRTKAVWLSASADLLHDARRDLNDIGALQYDGVRLLDLKSVKAGQRNLSNLSGWDKGIVFATYDLLISGEGGRGGGRRGIGGGAGSKRTAELGAGARNSLMPREEEEEFGDGSRLAQLVDWCGGASFEGLLVLDECHRAKNCLAKDNETTDGRKLTQKESKTSRAVVELQRRCRNARVLYVSATGATESENLCYMERLGLWGEGTAYQTKRDFVSMLRQYGVRAMELVAMELKQNGAYLARTLSYEGVKFELVPVRVKDTFRAMYDSAAELWQELQAALRSGAFLGDAKEKKSMFSQFYGAQLRFFKQLCTAGKVDEVERLTKDALARGHCVVIGLQSTGEARTSAYVAANGGADAVFETFSFEVSAQEIMLNLITTYLAPDSPLARRLVRRVQDLKLPGNPLDDLIDRLGGPDQVAEMTGRTKRMERLPKGGFKYVSRNTGGSLDAANLHEKALFQAGDKLVAIISDAASTGISLQADRSKLNQRLRVHITLELAWSADKTVQQLGRTHRSNQAQPPLYMIVSSDISGEHRFASAVAARLMQLGALTHGDRNAVSAVDVLAGSNFHTTYGPRALSKLYRAVRGALSPVDPLSPLYNITPEWLRSQLAEKGLEPSSAAWQTARAGAMEMFTTKALQEMESVGLMREDSDGTLGVTGAMMKEKSGEMGGSGGVSRLLNRLLAMRVDMQQKIFQFFAALLDAEVAEAKRKGEYETGIVRPRCGDIKLKQQEVIFMDPNNHITTSHYEFHADRGVPFAEAMRIYQQELSEDPDTHTHFVFSVNQHNDCHYVALAIERNERGRKIQGRGRNRSLLPQYFRLIRPGTGYAGGDIDRDEFKKRFQSVSDDRVKGSWLRTRWTDEYNRNINLRQQPLHLISGSLLPLLPSLDEVMRATTRKGSFKVMRVATSDGRTHVLGIHVEASSVADVVGRIQTLQPCKPSQQLLAAEGIVRVASDPGAPGPSAPLLPMVPPASAAAVAAPGKVDAKTACGDGGDGCGDGSSGVDDNASSASTSEDEEAVVLRRARTASRRRRSSGAGQRQRRGRRRKSGDDDTVHAVEDEAQEGERAQRQEALQGAGLWEESSFLALKKEEAPALGNTGGKLRSLLPKAISSAAAARRDMGMMPPHGDEKEHGIDKDEEDPDVLATAAAWHHGWPPGLLNSTVTALQLQLPLPNGSGTVVDGKLPDGGDESAGVGATAAVVKEEGKKLKRRRGRPPGSRNHGNGGDGLGTTNPQQRMKQWQKEKEDAGPSDTLGEDADNDSGSGCAGGASDAAAGKEGGGSKVRVLSRLQVLTAAPDSDCMILEDTNAKAAWAGNGSGRHSGAVDADVIVIDDDSDDGDNFILTKLAHMAARQQQGPPRPLQQQIQAPDTTATCGTSGRRPGQGRKQQQEQQQQRLSRSGRQLRPPRRLAVGDFVGLSSSDDEEEEEEEQDEEGEEQEKGSDGRGGRGISEQRLMADGSAARVPMRHGGSGTREGRSSADDSERKEEKDVLNTPLPQSGRGRAYPGDSGGIDKKHKENAFSHRTPQISSQLEVQVVPEVAAAAATRIPPSTAPKPSVYNRVDGCTPVDGGRCITHRVCSKATPGRRRASAATLAAVSATFAAMVEGKQEERDGKEVALTSVTEGMDGAEAETAAAFAAGAVVSTPDRLQPALQGGREGRVGGLITPRAEAEGVSQVMQELEDPMNVDVEDGRRRSAARIGGCRVRPVSCGSRDSRRYRAARPGPAGGEVEAPTHEDQEAHRKGDAEQQHKDRKRKCIHAVLQSSDGEQDRGLGVGGGGAGSRAVTQLVAIVGDHDNDNDGDDEVLLRPPKRRQAEPRSVSLGPARDATDGLLPMAASDCTYEGNTTNCVAAIAPGAIGVDNAAAILATRQQESELQGVTKGGGKQAETTTPAQLFMLTPPAIEGLFPPPAERNLQGPAAEVPWPNVVVVGSTAAAVPTIATLTADPPACLPAASPPKATACRKRLAGVPADAADNDIGDAGGHMSQGSWAKDSKVGRCAATLWQMDSTSASAAIASARPAGGTAAAASTPTSSQRHQDAASAPGDAMRLFASQTPWPAVFRPAIIEPQPRARLDLPGPDTMSMSGGNLTAAASGHLEPTATATATSGSLPGPSSGEQREQHHNQPVDGDGASALMVAGSAGDGVSRDGCNAMERLRAELEAEWRERVRVEVDRLREDHNRELMAKLVVARNLGKAKAEEEASKKLATLQRDLTVQQAQVSELQRRLATAVAAEEAARRALNEQQRQKEEETRAMRNEVEALRAQLQQQQERVWPVAAPGSSQHAVSPSAAPPRPSQETPQKQLTPTPTLSFAPLSYGTPAGARVGVATAYSPGEASPAAAAAADANANNVGSGDTADELRLKRSSPWPGSTQPSQLAMRHGSSACQQASRSPPATSLLNGLCCPRLIELGTPGAVTASAGGVLPAPLVRPAQPLSQATEQQLSDASASGRTLFVSSYGAAADVTPTRESILRAIVAHGPSGGISAAALVRSFEATRAAGTGIGGSASAAPSPAALRSRVASLLQDLVDEFDVMREGAGAANSMVDVTCEATLYRPL